MLCTAVIALVGSVPLAAALLPSPALPTPSLSIVLGSDKAAAEGAAEVERTASYTADAERAFWRQLGPTKEPSTYGAHTLSTDTLSLCSQCAPHTHFLYTALHSPWWLIGGLLEVPICPVRCSEAGAGAGTCNRWIHA